MEGLNNNLSQKPVQPKVAPQQSAVEQDPLEPRKSHKKLFLVIGAIVIVLIIIALILFFIKYTDIRGTEEAKEGENQTEQQVNQSTNQLEEEQPAINNQQSAINDTDHDGLSDSEEKTLRTNITKVDTDSDGLFDGDEVNFYKTDPLDSDTDGDGFLDGEEVEEGYNPLGAGKLLNFNEALQRLKRN